MEIILRNPKLPVIKTSRLVLRDIRIEDISDAYMAWINDPETTRFLEIRFYKHSRKDVEAFIQSRLDNTEKVKHFGIYDNNGERLIGNVSANINVHHKSADISYVIGHPDASGMGFATEAVHAIIYFLFKHCGIEQIWAGYYAGHDGSARVLEKNGFSVQGCIKKQLTDNEGNRVDHIIVGLLPEEYIPLEKYLGKLPPAIIGG